MAYSDSGILFSAKKKCTIKPCTVRHRRNLNAYYQVKEVNLKRLYALWFQVYDILEKAKLWRQWKDQWLPEVKGRQGWTDWAQRIFTIVNLCCMILHWWYTCCYTFIQLFFVHLHTECTTPRVNCNVNDDCWVTVM